MKKIAFILSATALASICCLAFSNEKNCADAPANQTAAIVKATTHFLSLLSPEQKAKVSFDFIFQEKATAAKYSRNGNPGGGPPAGGMPPMGAQGGPGRGGFPGFTGEKYGEAVWSNFPVSDVPRPGLQLGSLHAEQREAAFQLLRELLSPAGYEKVMQIMGSDQALTSKGSNFASGKDAYTLGIFGSPNTTTRWMVQFGGHHLALNIVIAGAKGALTPTLTGAQPSVYEEGGKTIRVLAAENDKAFDLLASFTQEQLKKAILNYSVRDLVLGPGHDGELIVPEGLQASAMNAKQKAMLIDLISQWAGIINGAYVEEHMEEIKKGIDETYFAWSGPATHQPNRNGSSYYRIQGPHVIIEFSPQGVGGDLTMHVHTIYRDPANNYGNGYITR